MGQAVMANDYMMDILRFEGYGDVARGIEGPVTLAKIEDGLRRRFNGNEQRVAEALGGITSAFDVEFMSIYGKTANETIATVQSAYRSRDESLVREQIQNRISVDQEFRHLGKLSGVQGLMAFASQVAEGKADMTFGGAGAAYLGLTNETTHARIMGAIKKRGGNYGDRAQEFTEGIVETNDVSLISGLEVMHQAFRTGKVGGKNMTEAELEKMHLLYTGSLTDTEARQELKRLAGFMDDPKKYKTMAEGVAYSQLNEIDQLKAASGHAAVGVGSDEVTEYARISTFQDLLKRKGFREKLGLDKDKVATLQKVMDAKKRMMEQYGESALEDFEEQGIDMLGDITKQELKTYNEALKQGERQSDKLQAFNSTSPMSSIVTMLDDFFTWFKGKDQAESTLSSVVAKMGSGAGEAADRLVIQGRGE
jgi:hypothetical protein